MSQSSPLDKWECKYKALRSGTIAMAAIRKRREKEDKKNRQRIIQLCYELKAIGTSDKSIYGRANKILRILKAKRGLCLNMFTI